MNLTDALLFTSIAMILVAIMLLVRRREISAHDAAQTLSRLATNKRKAKQDSTTRKLREEMGTAHGWRGQGR